MSTARLVIFDVDGTLVDSQADILRAMEAAWVALGRPMPARSEVLARVGLSLNVLFRDMAPDLSPAEEARLIAAYKDAYATSRMSLPVTETSPLFDGARAALDHFAREEWTHLAVATGKSRRGLDHLLDGHGLRIFFTATEVADNHPSKPHPSMLLALLADTAVDPRRAVMIGDTRFDMEMARAAGIAALGVSWGYHDASDLGADRVVTRFDEVPAAVDALIGAPA